MQGARVVCHERGSRSLRLVSGGERTCATPDNKHRAVPQVSTARIGGLIILSTNPAATGPEPFAPASILASYGRLRANCKNAMPMRTFFNRAGGSHRRSRPAIASTVGTLNR